MKVNIDEIIKLRKREMEINSMNLKEIEFIDENEEKINIEESIIKEFMYTGLSNCDFITTGFYKNGFDL